VNQEIVADPFFTPFEMLELMAGFYGVPKGERQTDEILAAVGLDDKKDAYVRQLSGGMKRRLMVAKALVHNPPVLILDEPTAGVDVELRRSMWTYVRELHDRGTTIILTTHYLEEAEELCDSIAIVNHGEIVACEPTSEPAGPARLQDPCHKPERAADGRAGRPLWARCEPCASRVSWRSRSGPARPESAVFWNRCVRPESESGTSSPRPPTLKTCSWR
jgi:ABC-type multidrug transport system ATPase subunit